MGNANPEALNQTANQHAFHAPRPRPNIANIPNMEDQHADDQVTTFYTEGKPMNFLSTATSLNELNKVTATAGL